MVFGSWEKLRENSDGKTEIFFLIFQMEREREEIGGEREGFFSQPSGATSPPGLGGRVAHTGAEAPLGRGAHGLTNGQPKWPHGLGCPLARSLGSSARILGIQTLILNLFLDYEP